MPAHSRVHYAGSYRQRAALVRRNAYANPDTRCGICGSTLAMPPHKPGDTWDADHVRPGDPSSPLRPAAASCNRSKGAAEGNRNRRAGYSW